MGAEGLLDILGAPKEDKDRLESSVWGSFKNALSQREGCHYTRIETGGTGLGIPDVNVCDNGAEYWVELKVVKGRRVQLSPPQVGWITKRCVSGGRVYIVAWYGRLQQIYMWMGHNASQVFHQGIDAEHREEFVSWADLADELYLRSRKD